MQRYYQLYQFGIILHYSQRIVSKSSSNWKHASHLSYVEYVAEIKVLAYSDRDSTCRFIKGFQFVNGFYFNILVR